MSARIVYQGNAAMYERQRREAQETADRLAAEGDADKAAWWQGRADEWARSRDLDHRRQEDRAFRARVFRRY